MVVVVVAAGSDDNCNVVVVGPVVDIVPVGVYTEEDEPPRLGDKLDDTGTLRYAQ
jgi:hypothetical protein